MVGVLLASALVLSQDVSSRSCGPSPDSFCLPTSPRGSLFPLTVQAPAEKGVKLRTVKSAHLYNFLVRIMTAQHFEIDIANSCGAISPAQIFCEVDHRTEGAISRRVCTIRLNWNTSHFFSTAEDFFAAFSRIREQLETNRVDLCCR
jgi:hypothetical protein